MGWLTELSNGFDFAQKAKLTSDGAHDNCPVRLADKPWLKVLLADLL